MEYLNLAEELYKAVDAQGPKAVKHIFVAWENADGTVGCDVTPNISISPDSFLLFLALVGAGITSGDLAKQLLRDLKNKGVFIA